VASFRFLNARRVLAAGIAVGLLGVALPPLVRTVSAQQATGDKPNSDGIIGAENGVKAPGPLPVSRVSDDDPKVREMAARTAGAPGPKVTVGPGEVAPLAVKQLPAGSKSAVDLIDAPSPVPVVDKVSPVVLPEILVPQPPDDSSLPPELKAKRKKFDTATSKKIGRSTTGERFSNADGSETVRSGSFGVAVDDKGNPVDDDKDFVNQPSGKIKKSSGVVNAELATQISDGSELFSVGRKGSSVSFGVKSAPSAGGKQGPIKGTFGGSKASYKEFFGSGSDLQLEVSEGGVKESIVLASPPAGTGPVDYRFPMVLDGFKSRVNDAGSVSFLDAAGKEMWVIPAGAAWEQPKAGDRPTVFSKVTLAVEAIAGGQQELVVRPDTAWLRDPARKYPVVIDPTITPGANSATNQFAYIGSGFSDNHAQSCGSAPYACFGPFTQLGINYLNQSLVRYNITPALAKSITSASLKLNISNCLAWPTTVTVRPLASAFDAATVTWNTRPATRPELTSAVISAAGVLSVDVSGWISKFSTGEWQNYGFQINGTSNCSLQVIGTGSSYLEVTYIDPSVNRPPSVPVLESPLNGATVSGSPVTLSASSVDPDGDPLRFFFFACKTPCVSGWTFTSPPSSSSLLLTGPLPGETWIWSVQAADFVTAVVQSGQSSFTVSSANPSATNENLAWGTSQSYANVSADNQPNAGVNTGTKRFVYSVTDAQTAWIGPALAVQRTYNSADTTVGAFGQGWSSILDARVDSDAAQNLLFRLPDGRREYHPFVSGGYRTQPGYWSTAAVDPNGGWTLLEKDGTLWRFRSDGRLLSIVDRNGRGLNLVYDAVTGKVTKLRALGYAVAERVLNLTWTGALVTAISDTVNPAWNYLYAGNLLSKVCDPRNNNTVTGLCTTYGYDASSRIGSVTKPKGNKDVEVGYYADGTVQWRRDGMANQWNFSYNTTTRTSTTTDPLGRVTTEVYNTLNQLVSRAEPGDLSIPAQTTTYAYDTNGYVSRITNSAGYWEYTNDYRGNVVQSRDPSGAISYYGFDGRDLMVWYRDARSNTIGDDTYRWTYGYDASGNRVRETNPYGWSRTWAYTNSATTINGLLATETDWLGNATNYTYNDMGDVNSIVYPGVAGDNVTYTYDTFGRKLTEIGRIASPGITYTYDALNAPLTITEPPVTNAASGYVHRRRVTLAYDSNHLKASETTDDIGGAGTFADPQRITSYGYDNNDRETSVTDPLLFVTSRTFTATGQVYEVTDAENRKTRTNYNVRDLPTSVVALAYLDPTANPTPFDKTLQVMAYDAAGRMTGQNDGLARYRTFSYDAMNRLLTQTLVGFNDRNNVARNIVEVANTWDAIGNKLTERIGNNTDGSSYVYDNAGRMTGKNSFFQPRYDYFNLDRNGNVLNGGRVTTSSVVVFQKDSTFDSRNRPLVVTALTGNAATNHVSTYTYNQFGTVATMAVAGAGTTTYGYDAIGRLATTTAPSVVHIDPVTGAGVAGSALTRIGYDTFGNVDYTSNPRNNPSVTKYDKLGRRISVEHATCASTCGAGPVAPIEVWTYDKVGNTKTYKDRRGFTTDYDYDTLNRPVRATLPQVGTAPRATRITQFDIVGNPIKTINEVGATVNTTYNERNLVKQIDTIDRYPSTITASSKFDYNDLGQLTWSRDPLNFASTFAYLPTGELTTRTDPVNGVWTWEYDAAGRTTKQQDPDSRAVVTTYDWASQPLSSSRYFGATSLFRTESQTYTQAGKVATQTNARGFATTYTYDAALRMTAMSMPATPTAINVTYGYDKNNNMVKYTDGNGGVTKYSFNEWDLRTSTNEPATTVTPTDVSKSYTTRYDSGGLPTTEVTPDNATTLTRTYDALGHVASENSAGTGLTAVPKSYTTDPLGRITAIGPLTFSYNDRNQLVTSGGLSNNATFTYDLNGRMTTKTQAWSANYPNPFAFGYNARGDLTSITDPIMGNRTQAFSSGGRLFAVYQGNTTRGMTYDKHGRVTQNQLKNTATAAVLNQVDYTYDLNDNPLTKTVIAAGNTSAGTHTYTYDSVDRLSTWKNQANVTTSYGYDKNGNRTSAGANTYTYDQRNRLLTGPSSTYAWTSRGTPTTQTVGGVVTTFTTDAASRITGSSKTGSVVAYQLDELDRPKGRTINGTQQYFNYSGFETDPVYQNSVPDVTFARGPSGELLADASYPTGTSHAIGLDGHGDATHWYNPTGATVSETKQYDPFGVVTATTGTGPQLPTTGYQGDWTDPTTGDVNMGARWYNPSTATFRTRDTYMGKLQTPFSLNRYTYATNNPMRYWDPTGHYSDSEIGAGIDWSNAGLESLYPNAAPVTPVSYETANPSAGVYNYITNMSDGSSTIATIAPTGIAVSTADTTDRSGNLSYTPDAAVAAASVILIDNGSTADAIRQAVNDASNAGSVKPSTMAIVEAAWSAPAATSTDAPIAIPASRVATFGGTPNSLALDDGEKDSYSNNGGECSYCDGWETRAKDVLDPLTRPELKDEYERIKSFPGGLSNEDFAKKNILERRLNIQTSSFDNIDWAKVVAKSKQLWSAYQHSTLEVNLSAGCLDGQVTILFVGFGGSVCSGQTGDNSFVAVSGGIPNAQAVGLAATGTGGLLLSNATKPSDLAGLSGCASVSGGKAFAGAGAVCLSLLKTDEDDQYITAPFTGIYTVYAGAGFGLGLAGKLFPSYTWVYGG
jgi:RHS repeat-associated protein